MRSSLAALTSDPNSPVRRHPRPRHAPGCHPCPRRAGLLRSGPGASARLRGQKDEAFWSASQVFLSLRRSSSVVPPQTPASWLVARANSRHSWLAVQTSQISFAASIWSRAMPVAPTGKKSSGFESRQSERSRQSSASQSCVRTQVSVTACLSVWATPLWPMRLRTEASKRRPRYERTRTRCKGPDQRFCSVRANTLTRVSFERPLVLGHRGSPRRARENTLEGFAVAREDGADGVELDVHRTRDGALVVHHDADIEGFGVIAEHLTADVRAAHPWVPTLSEVLDECRGLLVNVEIKNQPSDADFDPAETVAAAVV